MGVGFSSLRTDFLLDSFPLCLADMRRGQPQVQVQSPRYDEGGYPAPHGRVVASSAFGVPPAPPPPMHRPPGRGPSSGDASPVAGAPANSVDARRKWNEEHARPVVRTPWLATYGGLGFQQARIGETLFEVCHSCASPHLTPADLPPVDAR